ncbi:MAG TPA: hypothetical protein VNO82_20820 [Solirubrobacteraceae bacterium]|nr:hypothetical protein [Solirubrobacteraceae bacterium]
MAPAERKDGRQRARTPVERAEEAAEVQRRLKREAAERREAAAKDGPAKPKRPVRRPPA